MKLISMSLLIVILTQLCCWLDLLRSSFAWRVSGGCRVHAGSPWQWLVKEGVSCSPASPWGTGFFVLCLERPTGSCRGAMTGFVTLSLVSSSSQLFVFVGEDKWQILELLSIQCPRVVILGFGQSQGEMDGCITTEEAPEPICGYSASPSGNHWLLEFQFWMRIFVFQL